MTQTLKELFNRRLMEADLQAAIAGEPAFAPQATDIVVAQPDATPSPQTQGEEHQNGEHAVFDTVCAVLGVLKEFCGSYEGEQYAAIAAKADELCASLQAHMGTCQNDAQPQADAGQPPVNFGGEQPRLPPQGAPTPHPGSMSNVQR